MGRPPPAAGCLISMHWERSLASRRKRRVKREMTRAHASDARPTENRTAGVLLHPTSLPGRYGIGDLGDELIAFLDWAASAGMRVWQVLPLNPPGYGNSPYGCVSSFAGNPLLISPQRLLQASLLPEHAADDVQPFDDDAHVDYDAVTALKQRLLELSWRHFNDNAPDDQRSALTVFERENVWLDDWALFAALKDRHVG